MCVFFLFFLGLIFVIGMEGWFCCGWVCGLYVCISFLFIILGYLFVCGNGEKGYLDYRYDYVVFLGFCYYYLIEYIKFDWLKVLCYCSFKI